MALPKEKPEPEKLHHAVWVAGCVTDHADTDINMEICCCI